MARSPGDFSGSEGIAFEGEFHVDQNSTGTPGINKDFSPYDDDTNDPTSPQSGAGYRSRAWGEDTKEIGTNRVE